MPSTISSPVITGQSINSTFALTANGSIFCSASTQGGTLTYQWCKSTNSGSGGEEVPPNMTYVLVRDVAGISGSTTANLVFTSFNSSMVGYYFCRVGNGNGSLVNTRVVSVQQATASGGPGSGGGGTTNPPTTTSPYNPTSLGKGDGTNFYCKRLPFGYAQDQRIFLDSQNDPIYIPGTVNSYTYSWELAMACGNSNTVLRAPGTKVTKLPFSVPITLPVSQQTRPAPFMTPAALTTFLANCKNVFQDESCLDHQGVWHPLNTSRPQGRWQFCEAASMETPTTSAQITFPPPSGLGRSHYQGECSYEANVDGAS